MDELLKEEVYKCSKCGLCQSVCPVYLATKNEMFLPRGRFIIFNNLFNNKKKLSKKFLKQLDICLNCNLCKDFCPSDIDSAEIFSKIKPYNYLFEFKLNLIFFLSRLFNLRIKYTPKRNNTGDKIVYFEGCYNKYINSSDRNASLKLLDEMNYQVLEIISDCCGYKFLSSGNLTKFNINSNKIIRQIPHDIKYIVCSCDSCFETLSKILNDELKSKLIRIDELLYKNGYKVVDNVFYHKPLIRKQVSSFDLDTINKKGACSLMENFFMLKYKSLSEKIIQNSQYNNFVLNNKTIATTCNISKWGLSKIFKSKVRSISECVKKEVD